MAGARCWSSALRGSVAFAVAIGVHHRVHGRAAARLEPPYDRGGEAAGFDVRMETCVRATVRFDDGVRILARSHAHARHAAINADANLAQAEPVPVSYTHLTLPTIA